MVPFSIKCDYVKGICVVTEGRLKFKMPSEALSLVSTGIGVSVLAGILSGVCYVLAHGFGTRRRSKRKKFDWYCEICGVYLHSTINILSDDLVTCSRCGAKVCTEKCAKFIHHARWVCRKCLKSSGSWFQGILAALRPNYQEDGAMMDQETSSNPDLDSLQRLEREQIRDFIEKLVNVLLGENVDNASVSMLCSDRHYLPVVGQSACSAHTALKQLIQKLLREAVNLPLLDQARSHTTNLPEESANRTYEDLLATAIINKVVTGCQSNLPSSSANSVSSRLSTSSKTKDDREYFFGEETLETKWKTTDLDTSSVSSLEEWLHSDSRTGSRKYVDKVTLMIKQDIEEVENFDSENEDEEYFRSSSSLFNDSEPNWFLQKRKFQSTNSPVPVPMLVPNPSNEAKVLIGDKPLDDTSDLSDVGSDIEECIQPNTTHSLLVQSKNIIGGGKTPKFETNENTDLRSESSSDSGVKEVNGQEQKKFDAQEVLKTDISLDDDNVDDSSLLSVYSNTEKEAEYTEKYASLPRQIEVKTSTPQKNHEDRASQEVTEENNVVQGENGSDSEFVGGDYSKKEKEKWNHAVEMKFNPYTRESIERRIKRSNSTTSSSSYGPDYYARLAGKPSGGGKLSSEVNGVTWPPPSEPLDSRSPSPVPDLPKVPPPSKEFIEIEDIPHLEVPAVVLPLSTSTLTVSSESEEVPPEPPKSLPPSKLVHRPEPLPRNGLPPEPPKSLPPPRESIDTDGIHQALKAVVTPADEESSMSSQEAKLEIPGIELETSDSETDLSYVNSYDVEHSQVVKTSKSGDVHIPIKVAPVGLSYRTLENGHSKDVIVDTPVARPRILGAPIALNNFSSVQLRRHLSESSLTADRSSFDAAPKALHQRKDNTLISKIYKDPKVRLFSLQSREEIPGENDDIFSPPYHSTRRSVDIMGNSDDGLTSEAESGKTGKMSFFSSEEDLLSLNSESSFRPIEVVSASNGEVKVNGNFRSPSPVTPKPNYSKRIYSSHEDLLSIDERNSLSSLPPRRDNTLISKIYQDRNVRSFALKTHAHIVPEYKPRRKISSSDDEEHTITSKQHYAELSSADISLEASRHNTVTPNSLYSDQLDGENGYKSQDFEIEEVASKHVVSEVLEKFHHEDEELHVPLERTTSSDELDNIRVSVRDLRMKFENADVSKKSVISSLTARSLSKQVKEILKH